MGRHVILCGFPYSGVEQLYDALRATVTNFRFARSQVPAHRAIAATPEDVVTAQPQDIFDIDRILDANRFGKDVVCITMARDFRALVTMPLEGGSGAYCMGHDYRSVLWKGTVRETRLGIQAIHNAIVQARNRAHFVAKSVRYEDLLQRPEAVQARLKGLIGFDYRGRFGDVLGGKPLADETSDPSGDVALASIDSWRAPEHRERIIDHFSRWPQLLTLLKMYDYERDDRWFDDYLRDAMSFAP